MNDTARSAEPPPPFPEVTVLVGDPTLPDATKRDNRYNDEDFDTFNGMKAALRSLPGYRFSFIDRHDTLLAELTGGRHGFVLNFCDTGFRNVPAFESHIPALLEMLRIPYSGASAACMAICYDKALVRAAAVALGVPVPAETFLADAGAGATPPVAYPALIKPNCGDGSVGIARDAVVRDAAQARRYLAKLRAELPGRAALVQEYLPGSEYGVGVIGNPGQGFTVLPPLEVDYSGLDAGLEPILAFESKTMPDSPYWRQIKFRQAALDPAARRRVADYACRLFVRLGCRDYARFDFRTDAAGEIKLLEVNPNPAWAYDGKLAFMAGFAGIGYADMLRMVLEAAQARVAAEASAAVR